MSTEALAWTSDPPTVPGLYWHREWYDGWQHVLVDVTDYGEDGLYVHEFALSGCESLKEWRGEWYGPLTPPEAP